MLIIVFMHIGQEKMKKHTPLIKKIVKARGLRFFILFGKRR